MDNYKNIEGKIGESLKKSGRETNVKILAISKGQSIETIKKFYDLSIKEFGENRVQEIQDKVNMLPKDISWHFVGHLQTNKVKYLMRLDNLKLIHSVDSLRLARKISEEAKKNNRTIDILLQVNVAQEEQKYGFKEKDIKEIVQKAGKLENIFIKGLMTMAPITANEEELRDLFSRLRILASEIQAENFANVDMTELSMGMTQDFQLAVEEGATIVRIGRALFA